MQLMLPAFETSVTEIMNKWEQIISKTGSSEVDVWPHLTTLTADAISRAAFRDKVIFFKIKLGS